MAPAGEAGTKEPARRAPKRAEPLAPMLATAGEPDALDRDDDWVFELKWDGIRALATISGDELTLRSRNGLDLTASYPELAELVPAFDGDGVVDGEIVALDAEGRPSFSRLQRRMGRDRSAGRRARSAGGRRALLRLRPARARREVARQGALRAATEGAARAAEGSWSDRDAAGRRRRARDRPAHQRRTRPRRGDGQAPRQPVPGRASLPRLDQAQAPSARRRS